MRSWSQKMRDATTAAPDLNSALSELLRTCQDAARHGWTDAEKEAIQWAAVEAQAALAKADSEIGRRA